ncbi:cytidyltransferase-like protein [Mycoplasmopsis alligatoris A21JP2]|uniref:Cytidyltransferase-like protein n=1 Tax=Mycoplasmopsis alligatoris A21JP2 TaxID=747682 RepID=D4XW31_9BACT|nr:nucleotidyltransferase family protein [Mycoplasmopsis alligatoris]EFF41447.1 cytidyltransferase-like protein [Mycoplasmopsis alligatoris A21JP2]
MTKKDKTQEVEVAQETKKSKKSNPVKVGIVVEYNPFHNGHLYQLNWIKEHFENPEIIIAMSHKYSQRGEKLILYWKDRVKIAKKFGVEKAIKLDVNISAQAAHIFAHEAVLRLNKEKFII